MAELPSFLHNLFRLSSIALVPGIAVMTLTSTLQALSFIEISTPLHFTSLHSNSYSYDHSHSYSHFILVFVPLYLITRPLFSQIPPSTCLRLHTYHIHSYKILANVLVQS